MTELQAPRPTVERDWQEYSGVRESDSFHRLGRARHNQYTNSAWLSRKDSNLHITP